MNTRLMSLKFVAPLLLVVNFRVYLTTAENNGGSLWPLPQAVVIQENRAVVSPDLNINSNLPECEILINAINRYTKLFNQVKCDLISNPDKYRGKSSHRNFQKVHRVQIDSDEEQLTELRIVVRGTCEVYPTDTMDERYALQVHTPTTEGAAILTSVSVWGAIRGLETLSQLMYDEERDGGVKVLINTTAIIDFPRFNFRGLLLDTSRHFIPVSILLENLEAMAQNKLNVFHWHIVDGPSFPYQSKLFPNLSNKGAYDKNHVYSQKDIAEVIEFARVRGIRVVPEFDTPGHTQSWGKDQTELLTPCYKGGVPDGTYGPIDPIRNETYDFLTKFFGEVAQVFPDKYLHLGGDEVDFDCWKSNPDILDFMQAKGITGKFSKLEEYYMQKILVIAQKHLGKSTLVWQEVLDNQVLISNDTIVHVWKDEYKEELAKLTKAGYKTILSSCWYLNYIKYGIDWPNFYTCDPQDFNGSNDQKNLVMGGAIAMWGEYVDGTQVISRTWPRGSAVAERLWSAAYITDVAQATPRLHDHRCRMLKRGIRVEPANGPGFCACDPYI